MHHSSITFLTEHIYIYIYIYIYIGLLNKLFYSSNITLMTMYTIDIDIYHSDA